MASNNFTILYLLICLHSKDIAYFMLSLLFQQKRSNTYMQHYFYIAEQKVYTNLCVTQRGIPRCILDFFIYILLLKIFIFKLNFK